MSPTEITARLAQEVLDPMKRAFVAVGTGAASFCRPSRGPTS